MGVPPRAKIVKNDVGGMYGVWLMGKEAEMAANLSPMLVDQLAEEGGGGCREDLDGHIVAGLVDLVREDAHLVVGCTAAELVCTLLRRALYKHLEGLADLALVALERALALEGDNFVETACLGLDVDVVLVLLCRKGARSLRVIEHECGVEAYLLEEGESVLVVLLRLAAESGDHFGGESAAREDFPDLCDP